MRGAGLGVALIVLAGAACDGGLRVTGFGQAGGGGSTGGGAGGGSASIVGVWRNLSSLILSSGETVVFDVRWSFRSAGTCERTRIQTIVSGAEGTETTESIACTFVFSGSSVTVTFAGSSVASRFSVAFSGGDLLLDGRRFTRIG